VVRSALLLAALSMLGAGATSDGAFFIGGNYVRPQFSIRQNTEVAGVPVRFFTSRPVDYLGWRMDIASHQMPSKWFVYGFSFGASSWEAGYALNWEMPDLGVALDPFSASLSCFYFEFRGNAALRLGPVVIGPFVSVPVGLSTFDLSNSEFSEGGAALYTGGSLGAELTIRPFRWLGLVAGGKLTEALLRNPGYTVEEGLTLTGHHSGPVQELYGGLAFYYDY
jgi:hypothetical protein